MVLEAVESSMLFLLLSTGTQLDVDKVGGQGLDCCQREWCLGYVQTTTTMMIMVVVVMAIDDEDDDDDNGDDDDDK